MTHTQILINERKTKTPLVKGDDVLHLDISSQALAADTAANLLFADNTYAKLDFFGWCLGRDNPSRKGKDGDYWNSVKRRLSETIAAAR